MNESTFTLWICCGHCGHVIQPINKTIADTAKTVYLCYGILSAFMAFLTILSNSIFLISLSRSRTLYTIPNKLLMMLAISDLLQGCISWPLYSVYTLKMYQVKLDCLLSDIMIVVGHSLCFMTIFCIFVLVLSQYLSIVYPLICRNHVTAQRLMYPALMICFTNFACISLCVFQFRNILLVHRLITGGVVGLLLLLMSCFYIHMAIAIRRSRVSVMTFEASNDTKRKIKRLNQNIKLAKTALTILLAFIACFAPMISFSIICERSTTYSQVYTEMAFYTLALSNCVLDCLVYHWRIEDTRKLVRVLFQNCFHGAIVSTPDVSERQNSWMENMSIILKNTRNHQALPYRARVQTELVENASIGSSRVQSELNEDIAVVTNVEEGRGTIK